MLDVNLLSHRPALREALKAGVAGDAPAGANKLMSMAPMPAAPYLFAVARSDWSRVRDQTYLDRPNVIAYHRRLAVAGPTGLVKRVVFDIVVNAVQVRPGQAAAFDRFLARLEQGIVDSNLEALLAPENVPAVSAADLYRRSASQGVQWATLRGGAGGAQPDWVAVVPVKPVEINGRPSVGWWRVDPKTGDALAMTEGGGSTATEYSLLVRLSVAAAVGMWTFIGCGGAAPGAGGFKVLGCAVCAAVAAVIVMFAFAGAAAGAGAKGLVGFMAGSNGVVAGAGVSISCNAISGLMS